MFDRPESRPVGFPKGEESVVGRTGLRISLSSAAYRRVRCYFTTPTAALVGSYVVGVHAGKAATADGDIFPLELRFMGAVPTTAA